MKKVLIRTVSITSLEAVEIPSKDCFKVKVTNKSTGVIEVEGLPIEPLSSETFDGLNPGDLIAKNMDLNATDAISAEIYVTRYFYTDDECPTDSQPAKC